MASHGDTALDAQAFPSEPPTRIVVPGARAVPPFAVLRFADNTDERGHGAHEPSPAPGLRMEWSSSDPPTKFLRGFEQRQACIVELFDAPGHITPRRSEPLRVVIEVRQVHQGQRGALLGHHALGLLNRILAEVEDAGRQRGIRMPLRDRVGQVFRLAGSAAGH